MIRQVCPRCATEFQLDDGFAGGNCRCARCGLIHRVAAAPAQVIKPAGTVAVPTVHTTTVISLPIDPSTPPPTRRSPPRRTLGLLAGAAACLVCALVPTLVYLSGPTGFQTFGPGTSPPSDTGATVVLADDAATANRLFTRSTGVAQSTGAIPLTGNAVVFLIDRGQASAESTPFFVEAALQASLSMQTHRRFAVVFWQTTDAPAAFPITGMVPGGTASVAIARKSLADVDKGGRSDALATLDAVLARNPDHVILLTAKGDSLPDGFKAAFLAKLGKAPPVVSVLTVGPKSPDLDGLARETGGVARSISPDELRHHIQQ